jgi:hypothetical protein
LAIFANYLAIFANFWQKWSFSMKAVAIITMVGNFHLFGKKLAFFLKLMLRTIFSATKNIFVPKFRRKYFNFGPRHGVELHRD